MRSATGNRPLDHSGILNFRSRCTRRQEGFGIVTRSRHPEVNNHEGRFLPETVEVRRYDCVGEAIQVPLDHMGHISVRLRPLTAGKAISFPLDLTISPQSSREAVFWFYEKPKFSMTRICGQLVLDGGAEMALSDDITLILHSDSPISKL